MSRGGRAAAAARRITSQRRRPRARESRLLSTLHGAAVGVNGLHAVLSGTFSDSLWAPWTRQLEASFVLSAGYSLHDMIVMSLHGEPLAMWVHHLAVFLGSVLVQVRARASAAPRSGRPTARA